MLMFYDSVLPQTSGENVRMQEMLGEYADTISAPPRGWFRLHAQNRGVTREIDHSVPTLPQFTAA